MNEAFAGDEFLLFWKGKYYISLTGSNSLKETREGLLVTAKKISSGLAESAKPLWISRLAHMASDDPHSKTAYIKGNLGLYNLATISLGYDFKVEEGLCLETAGVKNFIFKFTNGDSCSGRYKSMTDRLKKNPNYKLVSSKPRAILLAGHSSFSQCTHVENFIIISISETVANLEKISEKIEHVLKNHN